MSVATRVFTDALANQRCGTWYCDPSVRQSYAHVGLTAQTSSSVYAYFKSTDGHTLVGWHIGRILTCAELGLQLEKVKPAAGRMGREERWVRAPSYSRLTLRFILVDSTRRGKVRGAHPSRLTPAHA